MGARSSAKFKKANGPSIDLIGGIRAIKRALTPSTPGQIGKAMGKGLTGSASRAGSKPTAKRKKVKARK